MTAQEIYRRNHSDIRGLARYSKDRSVRLAEVCSDRKFWFGDRWSLPASLPAQGALRVLNGSMRPDPLICNQAMKGVPANARAIVARVVLGALRLDGRR